MTVCDKLKNSWCARYFEKSDTWYVCDEGGYTADKMNFCFYCGDTIIMDDSEMKQNK